MTWTFYPVLLVVWFLVSLPVGTLVGKWLKKRGFE